MGKQPMIIEITPFEEKELWRHGIVWVKPHYKHTAFIIRVVKE
jgi:hypothetical protein